MATSSTITRKPYRTPFMPMQTREAHFGQSQPSVLRARRPYQNPITPFEETNLPYTPAGGMMASEVRTEDPLNADSNITSPTGNHSSRSRASLSRRTRFIWAIGDVIGLLGLYTLIYWGGAVFLDASARWNFGPTHTFHADAMLGTTPTHLTAWNAHGSIKIVLSSVGQPDRIYQGPKLEARDWGNLDALVVTISLEKAPSPTLPTLVVHLVGDISYWRPFFSRPTLDFKLVPDKADYRVVGP